MAKSTHSRQLDKVRQGTQASSLNRPAERHLSLPGAGLPSNAKTQPNVPLRKLRDELGPAPKSAVLPVQKGGRRFILDPRDSKFVSRWDLLNAAALISTATITPYEVGFLHPGPLGMFVFNRVIDSIFLVDMILQFFLAYYDPKQRLWQRSPCAIAKNYLRSWFAVDLVSVGVGVFDILMLDEVISSNVINFDITWRLEVLRVVRALRLFKMIRLVKARRNHLLQAARGRTGTGGQTHQWESMYAINYDGLKMLQVVVLLMLVSHWFACIWGLQTTFHNSLQGTWFNDFGYCTPIEAASSVEDVEAIRDSSVAHPGFNCRSAFDIYAASLYWAVMTITSIGYGDIAAATGNTAEQVVCTLLMLAGGMIWGWTIASLVDVLSRMNSDTAAFTRTMVDLNHFMSMHGLPDSLRYRLREYFHQTQHLRMAKAHHALLTMMSPSLKSEVMWQAYGKSLLNIKFLRDAPRGFMSELAVMLDAQVLAPGELAPSGFMYIVNKGIALYGGWLCTAGRVWGQDVIISDESLRSDFCGRALNYVEVYRISGESLLGLAEQFPEMYHHIRWCAIRMALKRFLLRSKYTPRSFKEAAQHSSRGGWNLLEKASRASCDEISRAAAQGKTQRRGSFGTGLEDMTVLGEMYTRRSEMARSTKAILDISQSYKRGQSGKSCASSIVDYDAGMVEGSTAPSGTPAAASSLVLPGATAASSLVPAASQPVPAASQPVPMVRLPIGKGAWGHGPGGASRGDTSSPPLTPSGGSVTAGSFQVVLPPSHAPAAADVDLAADVTLALSSMQAQVDHLGLRHDSLHQQQERILSDLAAIKEVLLRKGGGEGEGVGLPQVGRPNTYSA